MKVPCFNCNTTTDLEINFDLVEFVCPTCKTVYKNIDGELKFSDKLKPFTYENQFSLGQTATLKNGEYTISGVLIKRAYGFDWAEYILQNKEGSFLYLSEAAGHWILLEEVEYSENIENHPQKVEYGDIFLGIFDDSLPTLMSAEGYFDFHVSDPMELIEYINPPYILSFERNGDNQTAYFGKHISKSEIKKAFGVTDLPSKNGIGMVQPFFINLRNLAISFCVVGILMILTHSFLNTDRSVQTVLDIDIPYDQYINKDFTSPSFELKGSSAPLSITAQSAVDNSWANVQIALINEKTNEEIYASKDIEYYHGYEGGENWSEGSPTEEFNLCGIGAGKYHLVLTPMKASEDTLNQNLHINATWSEPSHRNVWLTCVFMGVLLLALFYGERYFETKRWEESNYSPYNDNDN